MRFSYILLILFCLVPLLVNSQISQGGKPIQPLNLKSGIIPTFKLPYVDNDAMLKSSLEEYGSQEHLKPFKYAVTFDVNLTPENSGRWIKNEGGYNIWQVQIKSEGAYSINLILDPYRLPPNARLFVFNSERTHTIGAFTSYNNKDYKSLALSPVRGDDIIIQYEEPIEPEFNGELAITKVNHDFAGILTDPYGRRPMGTTAGECNIDINCSLAKNWKEIKNSVCRVIAEGTVCTGSLINNAKLDKTPYVLSAYHCFMDHVNSEHNTVFLFNYESPYCGSLDGDITNSVSGSLKVAKSDSLDFELVKLTEMPPPEYRPYFAGWDASGEIPDSVFIIHHPQADIKKISFDYDHPVISSYASKPDYITNAFWKTLRWEYGTTQGGSSGGPYFNQNHRIIGTLTGGAANCSNSVNDLFARFDLAWNHYSDTLKQLKYWLDPRNTGIKKLDGLVGYTDQSYCNAFTNLVEGDKPALVPMRTSNGSVVGFWAGTNTNGVTEYTEKFAIPGSEILDGLSIGVARIIKATGGASSYITVKVYNGNTAPGSMIYSKNVLVYDLVPDAMNFVGFDQIVQPADTFFIGFDITNVSDKLTFAVYQANRRNLNNALFYKQNGLWFDYHQVMDTLSAALAFEVVACNVKNLSDTPIINEIVDIRVYPNPTYSDFNIRTSVEVEEKDVSVYDLTGRQVALKFYKTGPLQYKVSLASNRAGIYFLRVKNDKISASAKLSYYPFYQN
jgi:lysyl endopeptidase